MARLPEEGRPSEPTSQIDIIASDNLMSWMLEERISFAFTVHPLGKLFFVGLSPEGGLSIFERTFEGCTGLCVDDQRLYLASAYQIWRFDNALEPGQLQQGYDRLYVPQLAYTTGSLSVRDIALDDKGEIVFVNSLFSCLSKLSDSHSFSLHWQPPFISQLAPEDRCHLTGLALDEQQKPKYVTAFSQTDKAMGWKEEREFGGVLFDVQENMPVVEGLSLPHAPRIYQDKVWLLNSGTGEFGYVDIKRGKFEPVVFCPGYLRGLTFSGDYAVVTLSHEPEDGLFDGLPLQNSLKENNQITSCGLAVIHLKTGEIAHRLTLDGIVRGLYDVAILSDIQRPMALGLKTDEIYRTLTIAPSIDEQGDASHTNEDVFVG